MHVPLFVRRSEICSCAYFFLFVFFFFHLFTLLSCFLVASLDHDVFRTVTNCLLLTFSLFWQVGTTSSVLTKEALARIGAPLDPAATTGTTAMTAVGAGIAKLRPASPPRAKPTALEKMLSFPSPLGKARCRGLVSMPKARNPGCLPLLPCCRVVARQRAKKLSPRGT